MSPLAGELVEATRSLRVALCANLPTSVLLGHFSKTGEVTIQHYPIECKHPNSWTLRGLTAVRSYFDLLSFGLLRRSFHLHDIPVVDESTRTVSVHCSVVWEWRKSHRQFIEECFCRLTFDENLKVVTYTIQTTSPPGTCPLRARDEPYSPTTPTDIYYHPIL